MSQPKDTMVKDNNSHFSGFDNSRRHFMKLCGAATVGGLSSLVFTNGSEASDSLKELKTAASKNTENELFWKLVRTQFAFQPGLIYMNTGTEGSMPRPVLSHIGIYCREFASNPYAADIDNALFEYFQKLTRTNVGTFVGAGMDEIVLTMNTTEGMSFVANGLELQAGDEVLTTLHDHEGGLCCWWILRDRRGLTVNQLALPTPATSKDEIISIFENAITPQTKVMSFCHINYTTGLRMPVQELCQLAKDHGIISVVDGAHAIGMLNLYLDGLGCNFYACSPHKWLCAPPGTGVLYMRKDSQSLLWPTCTNLYPSSTDVPSLFQFRGQMSVPFFACVNDALDLQYTIGKDTVQDRILDLSTYLKDKIAETWGADKIFSPMDRDLSSGLVSFNPFDNPYDSTGPKTIFYTLKDEYQIVIRRVSFKDKASDTSSKQALRVSTHIFNDYEEIDTLINTIKEIMAGM